MRRGSFYVLSRSPPIWYQVVIADFRRTAQVCNRIFTEASPALSTDLPVWSAACDGTARVIYCSLVPLPCPPLRTGCSPPHSVPLVIRILACPIWARGADART